MVLHDKAEAVEAEAAAAEDVADVSIWELYPKQQHPASVMFLQSAISRNSRDPSAEAVMFIKTNSQGD